MADVLKEVITGNGFRNGGIVVGANSLGGYHTVAPNIDQNVFIEQSGNLDNKFDVYSYYTA